MKKLFIKLFIASTIAAPSLLVTQCGCSQKDKIVEEKRENFENELKTMETISRSIFISQNKKVQIDPILNELLEEEVSLNNYFKDKTLFEKISKEVDSYSNLRKPKEDVDSIKAMIGTTISSIISEKKAENLVALMNKVKTALPSEFSLEKLLDENGKADLKSYLEIYKALRNQFQSSEKIEKFISEWKNENIMDLTSDDAKKVAVNLTPKLFPILVFIANYKLKINPNDKEINTSIIKQIEATPYNQLISNLESHSQGSLKKIKEILKELFDTESQTYKILLYLIPSLDGELGTQMLSFLKGTFNKYIKQFLPDKLLTSDEEILKKIMNLLNIVQEKLDIFLKLDLKEMNIEALLIHLEFFKKEANDKLILGTFGQALFNFITDKAVSDIIQNIISELTTEVDSETIKEYDEALTTEIKKTVSKNNEHLFEINVTTRKKENWTFIWSLSISDNIKKMQIIEIKKDK